MRSWSTWSVALLIVVFLLLLSLQCWTSWRSCWATWRPTWLGYRPRCPESHPSPPACRCQRGASSADWPARAQRRTHPRSAHQATSKYSTHTHTHKRWQVETCSSFASPQWKNNRWKTSNENIEPIILTHLHFLTPQLLTRHFLFWSHCTTQKGVRFILWFS